MDVFLVVVGIILVVVGLVGSVLPFLPGPPLAYVGLLLQQLKSVPPFTTKFLIIWAVITIVVLLLDYAVPLYGSKRFGASKYGMWGCTIGLVAGIFFPPWGLVLGPFVGAFVGEILAQQNSDVALKAALGSFVGFLFGTLLKIVACVMMGYYLIKPLFA